MGLSTNLTAVTGKNNNSIFWENSPVLNNMSLKRFSDSLKLLVKSGGIPKTQWQEEHSKIKQR